MLGLYDLRVRFAALAFAAAVAGAASQAIAAPVNVALNQPLSASSQWSDACAAAKGNNGSDDVSDTCGGWSPSSADVQPWLQIDLGSAKQISALELVTRQNCCDAPETRQNFEIRASNDPSFATYVVLGSQGATALPFKATWTKTVTDTNSYRYIRATKTGYFFIAELRVLVETSPPPSNIALNRPASASSQRADTCAAAKANNGSTDAADSCGGWSPTSADAQPWWQVDLGSAYRITTLELVTRQNCCDAPETRQNFEIRASNDPNFATYVVLGGQGATALPFKATWTKTVTDTNSYRYIRATKPGYFFIAELRVLGNAATNQAPTVFLTSPANNASFIAPANIALSATAGDPDGSIARVEFYNGTTLIATDNNGADGWAINWNAVPQGSYALSAKAFDNANASGTSAPANVTVTGNAAGVGPFNFVYDEVGRLVGVSDAAGQSAKYSYDAVGNLKSVERSVGGTLTISEFTPNSGPAGTNVTIYGTGFSATPAQNVVKFNGVVATITSATPNSLLVAVPSSATTGLISVAANGGSASSSTPCTVQSAKTPIIAGFSPAIGSPGTLVSITGANFDPVPSSNSVRLNTSLAAVSSATASALSIKIPTAATSGKFAVTTSYGSVVSLNDFFVVPAPYSPTDIQVTGRINTDGTARNVALTTAYKKGLLVFDGIAGKFYQLGINAPTFTPTTGCFATISVLKPDSTLLVPPSNVAGASISIDLPQFPANGTYSIVINPQGACTATMNLSVTNVQALLPAITGFSPAMGPAGTSVIITGANFRVAPNVNSLSLNTNNAVINSATSNTIVTTVPAATGSGRFSVSTVYGKASSPTDFFVLPTGVAASDVGYTGRLNVGSPGLTFTSSKQAHIVFDAVAGQNLSLVFSGFTMTPGSSASGYPNLGYNIFKPDGSTLSSGYFNVTTSAGRDFLPMPTTGTYTIVFYQNANTISGTVALTQR